MKNFINEIQKNVTLTIFDTSNCNYEIKRVKLIEKNLLFVNR